MIFLVSKEDPEDFPGKSEFVLLYVKITGF